jgi:hypothetical protein
MDYKKIARVEGLKWLGLGLLFLSGAAGSYWMFKLTFTSLIIPGDQLGIFPAVIIGIPGACFSLYGLWLLTLDVASWNDKQAKLDAHEN